MSEVTVTLKFKSQAAKEHFMGGLLDGFGEEHCQLEWPHETGMKFDECVEFGVTVVDPFDDYREVK